MQQQADAAPIGLLSAAPAAAAPALVGGASLQRRIVMPVMLVIALAVALAAFLNYGKFARTFASIEGSRFAFIADEIRLSLEAGMDLGVPLPALAAAQSVIEREAAKDDGIVGIAVFAADGELLFQTGRRLAALPKDWLGAFARGEAQWAGEVGDALAVGRALANDIHQTVGGVAVLYSRQRHDDLTGSVARSLALAALVIAVLAGALTYLFTLLIVGRLRRDVAGVAAVLGGGDADLASAEPRQALATVDAAFAAINSLEGDLLREDNSEARR